MRMLSGVAGAVAIVAFLWLLLELGGEPLFGAETSRSRNIILAIVTVGSAIASPVLHRRALLTPARQPSPRVTVAEGILFTLVGGFILLGGIYWLVASGGFMGLHLIGFVFGGGLLIQGLRKLR
jgi:hypothetical protein